MTGYPVDENSRGECSAMRIDPSMLPLLLVLALIQEASSLLCNNADSERDLSTSASFVVRMPWIWSLSWSTSPRRPTTLPVGEHDHDRWVHHLRHERGLLSLSIKLEPGLSSRGGMSLAGNRRDHNG